MDTAINQIELLIGKLSNEELLDTLAELDPVLWCERVRTLDGRPFSLRKRKYLWDVYRDKSPKKVLLKSRQIEGTETTENLVLNFLYTHPYTTVLHAQPRTKQCERFSKTRLLPAINESNFLSNWYDKRGSELLMQKFSRVNPKTGKEIQNFYAMTGTFAGGSADAGDSVRGLSTDMVCLDEVQDMDLSELPTILEGMSHSPYKNQLYLGTPKFSGDALMQTWIASDMKEWYVTCPNCGESFYLTFENIIDDGTDDENPNYIYACPKCRHEISDNDRMEGKWIPTGNPNAEFSGYHITQLIVPWISANEIMEKKNSSSYPMKRFMTEVLGLPWVGDDQPITKDLLNSCIDDSFRLGETYDDDRLYAGVDWNASHGAFVTITNQDHSLRDFTIIKHKETDKIPLLVAEWLTRYRKNLLKIVCDAGPSLGDFYSLKKSCKKLGIFAPVYHCYYMSPPQITEQRVDDVNMSIKIGRSEIIQKVIEELQRCQLTFPKMSEELWEKLSSQYCNIASELNTSIAGQEFIQYISIGQDHAFHSLIYAIVATGGLDYKPNASGLAKKIENPRLQNQESAERYRERKQNGAFLRANKPQNLTSQRSLASKRRSNTYSRGKSIQKHSNFKRGG